MSQAVWLQALSKAGNIVYNAGESIVGDEVRQQMEQKLRPVLKLLEDPKGRRAFDAAFDEAIDAFTAQAPLDKRPLHRDLAQLLQHATKKNTAQASRDVLQRYVLANQPDRDVLDWWVQRQLAGQKFTNGEQVYSQAEVTDALDIFFRQLGQAFWHQEPFRTEVQQVEVINLLNQILIRLPNPVDVEKLRQDYLDSLRRRLEYLDLGGIAPKVANRTVKLRMEDIFVPIQAVQEVERQKIIPAREAAELIGQLAREGLSPAEINQGKLDETTLGLFDEKSRLAWHKLHGEAIGSSKLTEPVAFSKILTTPRAVLLGHPGTGKSTTLKYASYAIAAGLEKLVDPSIQNCLPILIKLVEYEQARQEEPTLNLRDYARDCHDRDRAILFRQALERGEALVMLDGLDEVIDPRQRAAIADQVEALVADYPDNHYLIASRIVGYEAGQLTGRFTHYTINPLPEASIKDFVDKWYQAIERAGGNEAAEEARNRAVELVEAIQQRPGIKRLAQNPLLLTIIALVNWRGRRLPNRRIEVYRYAAETLVESWPRVHRGIIFDSEEVLRLLEPVAYRLFSQRSARVIPENELMPLITNSLQEIRPGLTEREAEKYIKGLLPKLSEHSGLFLEQGFDTERHERLFGFLHLTFAEYLTARHLAARWEGMNDNAPRREFLGRYIHIPRWREVMLLMVQQIGLDGRYIPATQIIADILALNTPYEPQLYRNLLFAGQCLADDLRVTAEASSWILNKLFKLLVNTPIQPLQEQITTIAKQLESTAYAGIVVNQLIQYIKDEAHEVQHRSTSALREMGSEVAVAALRTLFKDKYRGGRGRAASILGEIGNEAAVTPLITLLEDEDSGVRGRAALALGTIGSEAAVAPLITLLKDEDSEVWGRAALALGEIGNEAAVVALITLLKDEDSEVRERAALALGTIGSEAAVTPLIELLKDEDSEVRGRAALALGEIGNEAAITPLIELLEDEDRWVRGSAVLALGETGSEVAVAALIKLLKDEDSEVWGSAASRLGKIGSEAAVAALIKLLEDEDSKVRRSAALALGRTGSEAVVAALIKLLKDEDSEVRGRAVSALGTIGSEAAVTALRTLLEDEDSGVRGSVASALGKTGSEAAVAPLITLLKDEDRWVRGNAASALGKIGSEVAVAALIELLKDEASLVRARAASALGEMRSEAAVGPLIELLKDEDSEIRGRAALALGEIGSEGAVAPLITLLEDDQSAAFFYHDIDFTSICDGAYIIVTEILKKHLREPEQEEITIVSNDRVAGPWQKG